LRNILKSQILQKRRTLYLTLDQDKKQEPKVVEVLTAAKRRVSYMTPE
jgi:hypothetical protein